MSGDSVPRLFVYGLTLVLFSWAVGMAWLATRRAWRVVRAHRPGDVAAAERERSRLAA